MTIPVLIKSLHAYLCKSPGEKFCFYNHAYHLKQIEKNNTNRLKILPEELEKLLKIKKPQTYGDLRALCLYKTKVYLQEDNPKTNENSFFAKHGKVGRERAKKYLLNVIVNNNHEDLLIELVHDLLGDGKRLLHSKLYRERLMEAVCAYFGITNHIIDLECKNILLGLKRNQKWLERRKLSSATIKEKFMEHIILAKTKFLPPKKLSNLPFKEIGNDQL